MKLTKLDRAIIEGLAKGAAPTTLNESLSKKFKKRITRTEVESRVRELIKDGVLFETHAVVNPIKVFKNVVLTLVELGMTEGVQREDLDKDFGLRKTLRIIRTDFPKISVVLAFVVNEVEYDFGLILGIDDLKEYKRLRNKLSEIKIFKDISTFPISAAAEFYFNPIALPKK